MALAPGLSSSTDPQPISDDGQHVDAPQLRLFVMALFFTFGGITSLNDVIIPKLKELFTLSYTQALSRLRQAHDFVRDAIGEDVEPRLRELLTHGRE